MRWGRASHRTAGVGPAGVQELLRATTSRSPFCSCAMKGLLLAAAVCVRRQRGDNPPCCTHYPPRVAPGRTMGSAGSEAGSRRL